MVIRCIIQDTQVKETTHGWVNGTKLHCTNSYLCTQTIKLYNTVIILSGEFTRF
uniref:Uncharacterized protein n=1 Tax=Octopus bimaculoides TaxID=37653 RepID=A0A0L8HNI9_OCTBM